MCTIWCYKIMNGLENNSIQGERPVDLNVRTVRKLVGTVAGSTDEPVRTWQPSHVSVQYQRMAPGRGKAI